ncbi:MAG: transcriptional regulator [Chlorobium sp.]|nr:transcriptional regulator [Chlorobium sp.]
MEQATLQALDITKKSHWSNHHPAAGYTKWMSVIDGNIVHTWVEAKADVILDFMDVELLQVVLTESALLNTQFHILFDLGSVFNITFKYKQAITDLFFNWNPLLGVIGFYNVPESMRITMETFTAVAPQKITVIMAKSYENAIEYIVAFKEGVLKTEEWELEHKAEPTLKKQYLQAIARISWLNMLDEQITTPPPDNQYYPFFKALDSLRCDLVAKEKEKEREIQLLQQSFEHRITQMVIKMNAQAEANKKLILDTEKQMATLHKKIAVQDSELTRRSTTTVENKDGLQCLLDQIYSLDIEPSIKKAMTDSCVHLIETDSTDKKLSLELTEANSLFLSMLQKTFPELNKRELRICMLVKLNYDTTEIASSIGISVRGMESIRFRMHKKLGLGKHQSIKTYLSELGVT